MGKNRDEIVKSLRQRIVISNQKIEENTREICELQSDIEECKQLIMEFDAKSFGRGYSPEGKP